MLLHSIAHSAEVHREIGSSFVYFSVPTFTAPPSTSVVRTIRSARDLRNHWQHKLGLTTKVRLFIRRYIFNTFNQENLYLDYTCVVSKVTTKIR